MKNLIAFFLVLFITTEVFSQQRAHRHRNGVRFGNTALPLAPVESWLKYDFINHEFIYYNGTAWVSVGGAAGGVTAGIGITDVSGTFNAGGNINAGQGVVYSLNGTGSFDIIDQNTGSGFSYQNSNLLMEGGNNVWLRAGNINAYISAGNQVHLGGDDSVPTGSTMTISNADLLFKAQYLGDPVPMRIQPQNDSPTGQLEYVLTKILDNGTAGWVVSKATPVITDITVPSTIVSNTGTGLTINTIEVQETLISGRSYIDFTTNISIDGSFDQLIVTLPKLSDVNLSGAATFGNQIFTYIMDSGTNTLTVSGLTGVIDTELLTFNINYNEGVLPD